MNEPDPNPPAPVPPPPPVEAVAGLVEVAEERVRLRRDCWPPTLTRAADTPGNYVALVAGLGVVRFTSARDCAGGWVQLNDLAPDDYQVGPPFPCPLAAVEVRLESIQWVAGE